MGRGLAAILPESASGEPDYREIPVQMIRPNPDQPRRRLNPETISGLAESIAEAGVIQPLIVRPLADGRYELIAGERRWRAAREAGRETVPALLRDEDEPQRLQTALIENVVREDLNPVDEARACAALVARTSASPRRSWPAPGLGRARPAISNLIRLLDLPDDVLDLLSDGELTEGHGRAILQAKGSDARRRLARDAVAAGWSVRKRSAARRVPATPGPGWSPIPTRTPHCCARRRRSRRRSVTGSGSVPRAGGFARSSASTASRSCSSSRAGSAAPEPPGAGVTFVQDGAPAAL